MEVTNPGWREASYSGNGGGSCVEVTYSWHKSARSNGNGGNCVEVARNLPGIVAIRDSKDPHGPALIISTDQWAGFISRIRSGA